MKPGATTIPRASTRVRAGAFASMPRGVIATMRSPRIARSP